MTARKSDARKRREGTYRADRATGALVLAGEHPTDRELTPPAWLPPRAKKLWRQVAPMLADSGVLAVADLPALAMLCAAWSDWHEARETIARQGSVAKGSRGQPRPHPMLARLDRARDDFLRGAEAFGLTPTGRARLSAAGFQAPREDLQTMLARELGQVLNGSEQ